MSSRVFHRIYFFLLFISSSVLCGAFSAFRYSSTRARITFANPTTRNTSLILNAVPEENRPPSEIPCLPSIGESSFQGEDQSDSKVIRLDGTSHDVNHVGKLQQI